MFGGELWKVLARHWRHGGMGPNAGRSGSRAHQNLMPRARPSSSAPIATVLVADVAHDIAHH